MSVYNNILDTIGNTPMVQLSHLDTGKSSLFLKLENQNPGGSIKDRTGLNMIVQAEKRGSIHPGDLIVEATAGNTGLGLALASRLKGYKLLLARVIPNITTTLPSVSPRSAAATTSISLKTPTIQKRTNSPPLPKFGNNLTIR